MTFNLQPATKLEMSKTLILGLGNPILGDDGVGWKVAGRVSQMLLEQRCEPPSAQPGLSPAEASAGAVEVDCLSSGGLGLMERLIGYDRAILIDAMTTGRVPAGTVSCFALEELPDPAAGHLNSAHDTSLKQALRVGRSLGGRLPETIAVVAVEAENLYEFSEELSQPVAAAVPEAAQAVLKLL